MPNPLWDGWYADPELHFFAGKYYLYPTYSDAYEKQTFFEAWSSDDLVHWKNEGVILDFADVPWSTNRAAWAPTCVEKNGKYTFYFSAGDGAGLGVAVSNHPAGPFVDAIGKPLIAEYHHGAQPIDAHAFIDDDGQAYLYYGGWRHAVVVQLGDDMISTVGAFKEITPSKEYVEGPFMLKRNGVYYFMWSEGGWGDDSYAVAYAKSDNPYGPFERKGIVLKGDDLVGKSAGHNSVLQLPGTDDYVICYHRRPMDKTHHNHRVVCLDRMVFDGNGDIVPVVITHEGVGSVSVPADLAREAVRVAQTEAVVQAWKRIEAWMQASAPAVFATLKPGATDEELQALQTALGVTFPPDMAASYRIHSGAGDDLSVSFGGWYDFFDLARILDEWTVWKELLDGGEFEGETSEPNTPAIRPDWWNAGWIPITGDGGGNHLCVDVAPAESGTIGQIITMWHDDPDRTIAAPSFAALLQQWAGELEAGQYVASRKYGLVSREEFDSEGYNDEEKAVGSAHG